MAAKLEKIREALERIADLLEILIKFLLEK